MDNRSTGKNFMYNESGESNRINVRNYNPIGVEKDFVNLYVRDVVLNKKEIDTLNINVETWADVDKNTYMCWGDYWVKQNLVGVLNDMGINTEVHAQDADVTIYLWGAPFPQRNNWPFGYNPKSFNVLWFYSHPERMNPAELSKYDLIFCLSKPFLETIKEWHPKVHNEPLFSCTIFDLPENESELLDNRIDILFIGNARGGTEWGRKAVYWLDPPKNSIVKIYGHKWHMDKWSNIAGDWYAGRYYPYEKLNQIYYQSKITLIDGHDDMNKFGFVQMKIFDVLASGGFPLCQYNTGIYEIFGDNVPMYHNKDDMNKQIRYYLKNENERIDKSINGREIALEYTYQKNVKKILEVLEKQK